MKVKVLVGILCALFGIFLLVLIGNGFTRFMAIPIAIVSMLCMHEIMGVSQCKNKVLTGITMVFSAVVSIVYGFGLNEKLPIPATVILAIYVLALLILMLKMYDKTKFENVAMSVFSSICVPMSMVTLIYTYNLMESKPAFFNRSHAVFCILMAMYAAWLCDTFAMFFGKAFGKHKMAPKISPNKSYEGAVAGLVGTTALAMITYFFFNHWFFATDTIKWWMVLICMPVCCIMGMCGDLAASVIKRNFGVKDFGTLLPEHGGAMDRVDSFLFSMPAVYIILKIWIEIAL